METKDIFKRLAITFEGISKDLEKEINEKEDEGKNPEKIKELQKDLKEMQKEIKELKRINK